MKTFLNILLAERFSFFSLFGMGMTLPLIDSGRWFYVALMLGTVAFVEAFWKSLR